MTDEKITDYTALTGANVATGDLFEIVDVSDTTMDATGTNKKVTADELRKAMGALGETSTDAIWDAKGDLAVGTGADTASKLAVGADDRVLTADSSQTTGLAWVAPINPFGDGSDGAVTLGAGTTTLTRDMFYTDLTVPGTATLKPAGFRIYCSGTLTVTGTIDSSGNGGNGNTAGTGGPLGSLRPGGQGGGAGTGAGASPQVAGTTFYTLGGGGGAVGGAGSSGAAGTVPSWQGRPASSGWRFPFVTLTTGLLIDVIATNGSTPAITAGGQGGSGGGGDGTNSGGAGGNGGNLIIICARKFAGAGTISANGGPGSTRSTGNVGGGGGGGGGGVFVTCRSSTWTGTLSAAGGTHGNGVGTGSNGSDGSAGTALLTVL